MRTAFVAARSKYKVAAKYEESRLLGKDLYSIWAVAGELHRNNWLARAVERCDMTYAQAPMPISGHSESMAAFLRWWDYAGMRGENLDDIYTMIISGQTRVGDVLLLFVSNPDAKTEIKARLVVVDGTRVRTPEDFEGKSMKDGGTVVHGVQYDKRGAEIGYWVCGVKNGEYQYDKSTAYTFYPRTDLKTGRPVARLLRRPDSISPSSSRGLPSITHVIPQIEDLGDLGDAALQSAYVRSLLSVMLETTDPNKIREATGVTVDESGQLVEKEYVGDIQSGTMVLVPPGTKPVPITHTGNSELVAYIGETLRHVSGALARPLEILLSNFAGINFSSSKNSFDKFARDLQKWIDSNSVFMTEVFRWVSIEAALNRGEIPTDEMLDVTWSPVCVPDPDPQKSAAAEQTRLACRTTTRTAILAKQGIDYNTYLRTIAAERLREKEILGEVLDSTVEPAAAPGSVQVST